MTLDKRSSFIMFAGGNDFFLINCQTGRIEIFVANRSALIDNVKYESPRGIIFGLLPRLNITNEAHSKATDSKIKVWTVQCSQCWIRQPMGLFRK